MVAFSGGVDSTLLLKVAADVLGDAGPRRHGFSPTYPGREIRAARTLARKLGVRHEVIATSEMDNPEFTANPPLRCYHCKKELMAEDDGDGRRKGLGLVVDGQNADDVSRFSAGSPGRGRAGGPLAAAGSGADQGRYPRPVPEARPSDLGPAVAGLPGFALSLRYADHSGSPAPGRKGRGCSPRSGLRSAAGPAPRHDRPDRSPGGRFRPLDLEPASASEIGARPQEARVSLRDDGSGGIPDGEHERSAGWGDEESAGQPEIDSASAEKGRGS